MSDLPRLRPPLSMAPKPPPSLWARIIAWALVVPLLVAIVACSFGVGALAIRWGIDAIRAVPCG